MKPKRKPIPEPPRNGYAFYPDSGILQRLAMSTPAISTQVGENMKQFLKTVRAGMDEMHRREADDFRLRLPNAIVKKRREKLKTV